MTPVHSPERLYYHGTHTEVRLGDRISFVTLFLKRERYGVVACIPDKTGRERTANGKDPEDWLIRMDNGTFTGWMYSPEDLQPPKRLKFVSRGDPDFRGITNDELEELERREEENVSWGGTGSSRYGEVGHFRWNHISGLETSGWLSLTMHSTRRRNWTFAQTGQYCRRALMQR